MNRDDHTTLARRDFLVGAAAAAIATTLPAGRAAAASGAVDAAAKDIKITRIVGFDLICTRPKLVGRNARLGVHGDSAIDPMVRVYTNVDGIDGLGLCRANESALGPLLGNNPFDTLYNVTANDMAGPEPFVRQSMPFWDLLGKATGRPVYQLLAGESGPRGEPRIGTYDGSIYFADLLEPYRENWQDRFRYEIDLGLQRGHRGFKVKIGRGHMWMDQSEGDARDVEVLKVIRDHAGPDMLIGADANNGYDPQRTRRFLEETADLKLAFVEEMFTEDVAEYRKLKEFMRDRKIDTLIADGETQQEIGPLEPFMKTGTIDVYQLDMNLMGCDGIEREAELARPTGGRVAPHNWGSLIGYYAMLHVARAIPNFYRAENDPLDTPALIADGYELKEGTTSVPDAPGFGLNIDEDQFARWTRPRFDLRV